MWSVSTAKRAAVIPATIHLRRADGAVPSPVGEALDDPFHRPAEGEAGAGEGENEFHAPTIGRYGLGL